MSIEKILNEATLKTRNMQSLREIALDFIREAIFSGHFKPGDHLVERDLSELLGISTTPIKEALRILSYDGIVVTVPRRGTYVSELIDTSIEEFMMLKSVLEGLASKLAATKITDEEITILEKQIEIMKELTEAKEADKLVEENFKFHMLIREAAKSPVLFKTVNNVASLDNAFRKRALAHDSEVENGFIEHSEIFQAIKNRMPDSAENLMKKHLLRTASNVLKKSSL